jgi:hypothetical protein
MSSGLCFSLDIISLREPGARETRARGRHVAIVEGRRSTPFRAFASINNAWLRVKFQPWAMLHSYYGDAADGELLI